MLWLAAADAAAQAYPAKPSRLILPVAAGSTSDTIGRMVARGLSERLGQQLVIDNQPGADGNIGVPFGSAGVGTGTHLTGELFKTAAHIDVLHVPYRGMGPAISDLVGGQISMAFLGLPSGLPQMQAGKVHTLGVEPASNTPAQFAAYLQTEIVKWGRAVRGTGLAKQ